MAVDEQLQRAVSRQRASGHLAQSAPEVTRLVRSARVRAAHGEPRGEVRMQCAERADREPIAQYPAQCAVAAIFLGAQSVTMLDARLPSAQTAGPGPELEFDARVAQDLAAPAVVIAGEHR